MPFDRYFQSIFLYGLGRASVYGLNFISRFMRLINLESQACKTLAANVNLGWSASQIRSLSTLSCGKE
jgi:hypothetical protein